VAEPVPAKPKVFISYSHQDEGWKDKLVAHLKVAAREGGFDLWNDRRIPAGADWRGKINRAIMLPSLE
jgi:TIR domain